MCGRYTLRSSIENLVEALEVASVKTDARARYNIAPTQDVAAVRANGSSRELLNLKWGLVPGWAKEPEIGARLINARSETVTEKPSFRDAFKHRRCLILADGFFEWRREENRKQPFYFQLKNQQPFAFAGLWEYWEGNSSKVIESCTILTTKGNEVLAPVHDRMPVIIAPEDYELWLDAKTITSDKLIPILRPYPAADMTSHPVGSGVNNPRSDSADLIAPFPNSQ